MSKKQLKLKLKKLIYKTRSGASLLIGLGLVTMITLFSMGVTTVVVSSIRESSNVNRANQAYYAAEGALESGLLANHAVGAGYTDLNPTSVVYSQCPASDPNCQKPVNINATYQIKGQVPAGSSQGGIYSIPTPGTGNVEVNCDPLVVSNNGNFYYSPTSIPHYIYSPNTPPSNDQSYSMQPFPVQDHPCNWNKLKVGETIAIPLYYTDSANIPHNILSANSQLKLRARTGCTNGNLFCSTRPLLDVTSKGDANTGFNDPILTWQITAEDSTNNKKYTLNPYYFYNGGSIKNWATKTSFVVESKINGSTLNNQVLDFTSQNSIGVDANTCSGKVKDFLFSPNDASISCATTPNWSLQHLQKPVLKLTIIHNLEESGLASIPYLEYQLLTDASINIQPTDTVQTITAEGFSSSFKQVIEVKVPQESGLVEYVIQQ